MFRFHSRVDGSRRSATVRFWNYSGGGPIGRSGEVMLSQGFSQMLILSPFPPSQPALLRMMSLPTKIPRQPCEIAVFAVTTKKSSVEQYFPIKILPSTLSGLLMILQLIFAKKASLKLWISLKSSPPCSLGRISLDQAIHAILLLSSQLSHQNLVSADWILLQRETGSWKQDIAWEGTAESTLLSIVIFPAVDRNLLDQPFAFCFILSTMDEKRSRFDLPKCSGSPR